MRRHPVSALVLGLSIAVWLAASTGTAAEPETASQWLAKFNGSWDEKLWEKQFRTAPGGYMRPLWEAGWKSRMSALQGVVTLGEKAVPPLIEALGNKENTPQRIFAAQALGYLPAESARQALLQAAQNDPDAAVRLYAVDALGMLGTPEKELAPLAEKERNRDVLKHLGYAQERQGQAVERSIIEQLRSWEPQTIDSAAVGKAAPEFELTAATGEKIALTDFRGKSPVVLVFIYGDT